MSLRPPDAHIPAQRTDAGGHFGLVTEPDYRARNPNGMVPLLEDGDATLWESNVIVRYLCARHAAGTLYPEPLATRFTAEMWMDWQQTTLNGAGRDAFIQLVRTPQDKRKIEADDFFQGMFATVNYLIAQERAAAQAPAAAPAATP